MRVVQAIAQIHLGIIRAHADQDTTTKVVAVEV